MNTEELENYITTEEGKQWFDSHCVGLVNKKNELLEKLAKSKTELESLSALNQVQAEKLTTFENYLSDRFVKDCFYEGSTDEGYFSLVDGSENAVKKIIESETESGFKIVVEDNKIKLADSNGKSFQNYWNDWKKSDGAKHFLKSGISGGGGVGSSSSGYSGLSKDTIQSMNVEELAKRLENPVFKNQINNVLR